MAKVVITANKLVVQSEYKLSEIRSVEKHNPSALVLKDEDKKEFFKVASTTGEGSVGKFGISFGSESATSGKAIAEVTLPEGLTDVADWAAEEYGTIISNLIKVEANVKSALETIVSDKQKAKGFITVI